MQKDLSSVAYGLFASRSVIEASDYADGSSEALRRDVKACINGHRQKVGLLPATSMSCQSSDFDLKPGESPADAARILFAGVRDMPMEYLVLAFEDEAGALAVREELQPLFDQRYGANAPVVLGIQAPTLFRFSVKTA